MPTNPNQDRFSNLPHEILLDILSRLPIRALVACKGVCKAWRGLVESPELAPLHLSRSSSASRHAAIRELKLSKDSQFGFLDNEVLLSTPNAFLLSHPWPKPDKPLIHSSVNGLLFMIDTCFTSRLFVCNPITREYVTLENHPQRDTILSIRYAFGFGVSKISGKYKVVKVSLNLGISPITCQVYTLGTGKWRGVAVGRKFSYGVDRARAHFVNGNLYWLVFDNQKKPRVSCFDLETERFVSFNCPPPPRANGSRAYTLSGLGDRLYLCDDSDVDDLVVWFMKECGDKKSWFKEFVIKKPTFLRNCGILYPIKGFGDGGLLFVAEQSGRLFYYSTKTERIREKGLLQGCDESGADVVIYSPTFASLRTLATKNMGVQSF